MRAIIVVGLVGSACTTLGPMPATTGVSAIPAGRPGGEAQLGAMPAFHLSSSVSTPRGSATGHAAVVIEPDRWLKVPGLIAGGRVFGEGDDSPVEPLLGYRQQLDEEFAVAAIVYGTSKRATERMASYHGFRMGAEIAADGRIVRFTRWLALHAQGAISLTRIVASGKYCVNAEGKAADCSEDMPETNVFASAKVRGFFPTATATFALDIGRRSDGVFHSLRFAIMTSAGRMPRVVDGDQADSDHTYFALGLAATLGVGSR